MHFKCLSSVCLCSQGSSASPSPQPPSQDRHWSGGHQLTVSGQIPDVLGGSKLSQKMFVISDKDQPESGKEGKEQKERRFLLLSQLLIVLSSLFPSRSVSVSLLLSSCSRSLSAGSDYNIFFFLIRSLCPALMHHGNTGS